MNLAFLKKKKFYIPVAIVLVLLAAYFYGSYRRNNQPVTYETVKAVRDTLTQTVDATGKIESVNDLSLRFEAGGTLDAVKVSEGDKVKAGTVLANIKLSDLNAAVAQASANLNQKLAGATTQERSYYQAAMEMAKASLDQAKIDASNSVATAEANVETAKNNLKLAEGGENSEIVGNAYENAVAVLQSSLSILSNGIGESDNILGIDNAFANDSFESALAVLDSNKKIVAYNAYLSAKEASEKAKTSAQNLTSLSPRAVTDSAMDLTLTAFEKVNQLLVAVSDVLDKSLPVGGLSQISLENKKSAIASTRTTVNAGYSSLLAKKQGVADAKNSFSTFQVAYDKALRDQQAVIGTAQASVVAKEAAYTQAVSNWEGKTVAPRDVDLAFFRAALSQAVAARDKGIIKAPIDGVIVKINKKKGEMVSMSDVVIQMLSPHYEVKVDIPETDVPKLSVDNNVEITLDAFGDDVKFSGKIVSIEPASTVIQDVVYYNVTVTLDETDVAIKPGMTANVKINTANKENVIVVPSRSVRTNSSDSSKYVRLLENGKEVEKVVTLGLKGDNGMVEITDGLVGGEDVIVSTKTAN